MFSRAPLPVQESDLQCREESYVAVVLAAVRATELARNRSCILAVQQFVAAAPERFNALLQDDASGMLPGV